MDHDVLRLVNGWMQITVKPPRTTFPRITQIKIEEVTSVYQDPDDLVVHVALKSGVIHEYNFGTALESLKFYNSVTQILLN